MTRVFLSTPSPRMQSIAQECASYLTAQGVEVLRAADPSFGDHFDAQVTSYIRRADVVLAFYDGLSLSMGIELGFAFGAQKQVLLVATAYMQLPRMLQDVQILQIGTDLDDLFERITRTILQLASDHPAEPLATTDVLRFVSQYRIDPGILEQLNFEQFTTIVQESFKALGYAPGPATTESGVDFYLNNFEGPHRIAVEVKKWPRSRRVPIGVVQQFLGSLFGQPVESGLMLSSAEFTDSAREFALRTDGRVRLWNFDELAKRLEMDPRVGSHTR